MKDKSSDSQAREVRNQQRRALRDLLEEAEQVVPSTTAQIFAALQRERQPTQNIDVELSSQYEETPIPQLSLRATPVSPVQAANERQKWKRRRSRVPVRALFSLVAVAAIVIIAIGLFNNLIQVHQSSSPSSDSSSQTPRLATSPDWSSVVMTYLHNGSFTITDYDPVSEKYALLASSPYLKDTAADGISHDGQKLLYHAYDGGKTLYYLQTQVTNEVVYAVTTGKGGKAVWSTDDRYIFISMPDGIEQIDTTGGTQLPILQSLKLPDLRFFHDGYLFFFESSDGVAGVLKRVSVNDNARDVQTVTQCPRASNFWLAPDGITVYYICLDHNDLYAVHTDGTNAHVVRTHVDGSVIGFADDNSPLLLSHSEGKYRVVQLGNDQQHDQVRSDDIAPQATSVDYHNVAVAPYGTALVARATYGSGNGEAEFWYNDLTSKKRQQLSLPAGVTDVYLVGWNKLLPPGVTPPPRPTQATAGLPLGAWHDVLVAENDSNAGLVRIVNYDTNNASNSVIPANKPALNTVIDGISVNGRNVLYHDSVGGKTRYWIQVRFPNTGYFYQLDDSDAGNALWMPDSRHVLILSLKVGVVEVDTQTGQEQSVLLLPLDKAGQQIHIGRLAFYRGGYLYFIGAEGVDGVLCRVQLGTDNAEVQQIMPHQIKTTYWLSPDGTTIFFADAGTLGQAGIYAVRNDGTNLRLLRAYRDARPIGYAADASLMLMRYINGTFQVIKLGASPTQDQVILSDVAPKAVSLCDTDVAQGATPICDSSIALAPLSKAIVIEAGYADGSRNVWYIDLQSGRRLHLSTRAGQAGVQTQLIGWDQIVPAG